ncbi:hypothetical protein RJK40_004826 [Salmonella enterica]|nr:hypothetical protein [Salmonella enterica]
MKKNTLILPVIISSLFWISALRAKGITIFHTNYLHAHVTPFKAPYISNDRQVGSFSNIAIIVKNEYYPIIANTFLATIGNFFQILIHVGV